jgi:hypothetical protein
MEKINNQKVWLVWLELKIFADWVEFLKVAGWPCRVALGGFVHGKSKNQFPLPLLTPNNTFQQESCLLDHPIL